MKSARHKNALGHNFFARIKKAQLVNYEKQMGSDYDIQLANLTIGRIDTSCQVWNDVYRVMVFDESYMDILAAITIICDNVVDEERKWQS